jgi:hypothetical protein
VTMAQDARLLLVTLTGLFAVAYGSVVQMFVRTLQVDKSNSWHRFQCSKYGYSILCLFALLTFSSQPLIFGTYPWGNPSGPVFTVEEECQNFCMAMFVVGTAPLFTQTRIGWLAYVVVVGNAIGLARDLFRMAVVMVLGPLIPSVFYQPPLDWFFLTGCLFVMLALLLALVIIMRQSIFVAKGVAVAMQRSSRLSRMAPLAFILVLALSGFLFMPTFKAVLWLVFLFVCYPVLAAFSSSIIDGTKFSSEQLTGLYVQSYRSLPLFQTIVGAKSSQAELIPSVHLPVGPDGDPGGAKPVEAAPIQSPR